MGTGVARGEMTHQEAHVILGLEDGATEAEIMAAQAH